jgi:hypothetical protein
VSPLEVEHRADPGTWDIRDIIIVQKDFRHLMFYMMTLSLFLRLYIDFQ